MMPEGVWLNVGDLVWPVAKMVAGRAKAGTARRTEGGAEAYDGAVSTTYEYSCRC